MHVLSLPALRRCCRKLAQAVVAIGFYAVRVCTANVMHGRELSSPRRCRPLALRHRSRGYEL